MTYPLEPLATAAGIRLGVIGGQQPGDPAEGMTALAIRLETSTSTLKRARRDGLTLAQADTWAIRLGRMPQDIWGADWWADVADPGLHGIAATNDAKTTCPAGHQYDRIDNTGARRCSTCQARANRWSRARRRLAAAS